MSFKVIPQAVWLAVGSSQKWLPFFQWLDNYLSTDSAVVPIVNKTGGGLTKGTAVAISGWDVASSAFKVIAADNSDATKVAAGVLAADLANNATGTLDRDFSLASSGLDTSGGGVTVGDPVYLGTGGALTLTKPTNAGYAQEIARVVTKAASGTIQVLVRAPLPQIGSSMLVAASVTVASLAAAVLALILPRLYLVGGVDASGGPQQITTAGTAVGDKVLMALDLTAAPAVDQSAHFQATVTVAGKVVQNNTDLHTSTAILLIVGRQS